MEWQSGFGNSPRFCVFTYFLLRFFFLINYLLTSANLSQILLGKKKKTIENKHHKHHHTIFYSNPSPLVRKWSASKDMAIVIGM